jgi:hypothetical protein
MNAAIYAAHMDSVLKLAAQEGGVSRPQIIKELNVTRAVASGLIDKCGLEKVEPQKGRTEYFAAAVSVKQSRPAAVQAVAVPEAVAPTAPDTVDVIAALDAQIMETRASLRDAAAKAGKALGEWGTQQAIVDALRTQMTEQIAERMRASP